MTSKISAKAQERLLYFISPVALIVLWQVLLMAGIGDRRFVPAPSDIAWRYWQMIVNGELAYHSAATAGTTPIKKPANTRYSVTAE